MVPGNDKIGEDDNYKYVGAYFSRRSSFIDICLEFDTIFYDNRVDLMVPL
jgi:hypothetical protein